MSTIEDVLLRLNLKVNNCRGQCYDGASVLAACQAVDLDLLLNYLP